MRPFREIIREIIMMVNGIIQRNFSEMNSDTKIKDSLMENIFGGNTEATKEQLQNIFSI